MSSFFTGIEAVRKEVLILAAHGYCRNLAGAATMHCVPAMSDALQSWSWLSFTMTLEAAMLLPFLQLRKEGLKCLSNLLKAT